ncbi:GntR family transcriptional regulator [Rhizobium sp. ARZ01]|uniref:FCD domain-containing protein n=1 Tax=Rhizobium sp. ARZ01 TaxID=2769313 RepID=UPI001784CCCA|nr:GntR family transcriptional regulator [Rhizobium sp. ARZ01]
MDGSQAHLAYLTIEGLIVTLRLKPGALVTERQMIDVAGHGRTPVREAIQKLAWQGLIAVRPRVGLQITPIGPDDHRHVLAARQRLEPLAAELVATHASREDRALLVETAEAMSASALRSDMAGFLAADKAFDEIMEAVCPNKFLTAALAPLQPHARRLWFANADDRRMKHSVDLHVQVISAIVDGQASSASDAMSTLMAYLGKF